MRVLWICPGNKTACSGLWFSKLGFLEYRRCWVWAVGVSGTSFPRWNCSPPPRFAGSRSCAGCENQFSFPVTGSSVRDWESRVLRSVSPRSLSGCGTWSPGWATSTRMRGWESCLLRSIPHEHQHVPCV